MIDKKIIFLIGWIIVLVSVILIIISFNPIQAQECVFTSMLEKSWVMFGERPAVMGFVINCDDNIEYQKKDTVYIRILDVDGNVVDDNWKASKDTARTKNDNPTQYIFNDQVYRGGSQGNADISQAKTVHIQKNMYFEYLPQINSIDFEHRGFYWIEVTYNNEVKMVHFITLDPEIWYEDEQ